MTVTSELVKKLREMSNAGIMDCKRALTESNGNLDQAMEFLYNKGLAKAADKASRIAAEGVIVVLNSPDAKRGLLVEVNCETDFVSREARFKAFAKEVASIALQERIESSEVLQAKTEAARLDLVRQLGENILVRRLAYYAVESGVIGTYAHGDANGIRIGALVVLKKGDAELARDLAMQVAAMHPVCLDSKDAAPDTTLLGQSFIKDPSQSVATLLAARHAEIETFVRFEVGECVEKQASNFVEEVMAQVRGE